MSRVYTYSFEDTIVTFSHPNFGTYSAYGTGIGSLAIAYANDVTKHDVAADLAVVVSKWYLAMALLLLIFCKAVILMIGLRSLLLILKRLILLNLH